MRLAPNYRLRLFLSIDLVGSTAYKNKAGASRDDKDIDLRWVKQIKHFYSDLPINFRNKYEEHTRHIKDHPYKDLYPRVWKTLGDEIIMCCRVISLEHLALCVSAFVVAVKNYGTYLDEVGGHLDVKSTAWIAAFPEPNVTVVIAGREENPPLVLENAGGPTDEAFEAQADLNPGQFDFLGKHIDGGFRIGRFAAPDAMALSLELAYLLAKSCHEDQDRFAFNYHGRHSLKGVIGDKAYPIVTIDTERSARRRSVKVKEQSLIKKEKSDPLNICEFIHAFMLDEDIEHPVIAFNFRDESTFKEPESYLAFKERWENEEAGTQKSMDLQIQSEASENDTGGEVPENVSDFFEKVIKRYLEQVYPNFVENEDSGKAD